MHPKFGPGILFCTDWSHVARQLDIGIHHCYTNPKLIPRPVVCMWLFSLGMGLV